MFFCCYFSYSLSTLKPMSAKTYNCFVLAYLPHHLGELSNPTSSNLAASTSTRNSIKAWIFLTVRSRFYILWPHNRTKLPFLNLKLVLFPLLPSSIGHLYHLHAAVPTLAHHPASTHRNGYVMVVACNTGYPSGSLTLANV